MAKIVTQQRRGWWSGRSLRERWLILAMLALLALVLVWFLLLRPLGDARAAAEERLAAATADLGRARALAFTARQAAPGTPSQARVPLPLDSFLTRTAGEQGFTNIQVTALGNDRARIALANARAQPFLAWIGQLEARGVTVETLNARANGDQTIAVDATLRARGG
jgi:general secretion pathway protein M